VSLPAEFPIEALTAGEQGEHTNLVLFPFFPSFSFGETELAEIAAHGGEFGMNFQRVFGDSLAIMSAAR